jgi:ribosomal protein S18 acetylase RimI-like enzyme
MESELDEYVERLIPDYAAAHVRAGSLPPDAAEEMAREQVRSLLPNGVETQDQYLFWIEDADTGTRAGLLWFARETRQGEQTAFIYDIEIFDAFRRRGYASAALHLLEEKAREVGAATISLHVFGNNTSARDLYRKLGFEETHVMMAKSVEGRGGRAG